jgi:predicted ATPase
MSAVRGLLDRAIDGHGAVVGVVGPPGIGKSRLVRELSGMAASRGVEVVGSPCRVFLGLRRCRPRGCQGATRAADTRRGRWGVIVRLMPFKFLRDAPLLFRRRSR